MTLEHADGRSRPQAVVTEMRDALRTLAAHRTCQRCQRNPATTATAGRALCHPCGRLPLPSPTRGTSRTAAAWTRLRTAERRLTTWQPLAAAARG